MTESRPRQQSLAEITASGLFCPRCECHVEPAETPGGRDCCPDCGTVDPDASKPTPPRVAETRLRYSAQGGGGA